MYSLYNLFLHCCAAVDVISTELARCSLKASCSITKPGSSCQSWPRRLPAHDTSFRSFSAAHTPCDHQPPTTLHACLVTLRFPTVGRSRGSVRELVVVDIQVRLRSRDGLEWTARGDGVVLAGRWYHVAAAWSDAEGLSLYVDGALVDRDQLPRRTPPPTRSEPAGP